MLRFKEGELAIVIGVRDPKFQHLNGTVMEVRYRGPFEMGSYINGLQVVDFEPDYIMSYGPDRQDILGAEDWQLIKIKPDDDIINQSIAERYFEEIEA